MRCEPSCRDMHFSTVVPMDRESLMRSMAGRIATPRTDPDCVRRCDGLPLLPTLAGGYDIPDGEHATLAHDEHRAWGGKLMIDRLRAPRADVRINVPPGQLPTFCRSDGWARDFNGREIREGVFPTDDPHAMNGKYLATLPSTI